MYVIIGDVGDRIETNYSLSSSHTDFSSVLQPIHLLHPQMLASLVSLVIQVWVHLTGLLDPPQPTHVHPHQLSHITFYAVFIAFIPSDSLLFTPLFTYYCQFSPTTVSVPRNKRSLLVSYFMELSAQENAWHVIGAETCLLNDWLSVWMARGWGKHSRVLFCFFF